MKKAKAFMSLTHRKGRYQCLRFYLFAEHDNIHKALEREESVIEILSSSLSFYYAKSLNKKNALK